MPASRAQPTARSTFAGSWVRPSASNTCARIDCTPNETRFTPARAYSRSLAASTESGLHSTVTSAASARGIASRIDVSARASSSDGVPPPKNTRVASGNARRSMSVMHPAT